MITPINMTGISAPQNQGYTASNTAPQYAPQQPMGMPAAQPMFPQQQMGLAPQQPMVAAPMQMNMMPAQQPVQSYPPQGYQQVPATNGVRTSVSYGPPATIPWR
jgi:hypothetical protein